MSPETITVKYTCGCEATGIAATRDRHGVPHHCGMHGTKGDDMRVAPEPVDEVDSTDEPAPSDPAESDESYEASEALQETRGAA